MRSSTSDAPAPAVTELTSPQPGDAIAVCRHARQGAGSAGFARALADPFETHGAVIRWIECCAGCRDAFDDGGAVELCGHYFFDPRNDVVAPTAQS